MVRPSCCEKNGMKKGPWSPEEDLSLVSCVQEHGARNRHAVPANTGTIHCSDKSCRLRWTNYLRPGINRDNFSDQEEKLIIELQTLLGNRWSTIALYMPDRTDNDIKNYWNTHLKKKLAKTGAKGQWEQRLQMDLHTARQAFQEALSMDTTPPAIKLEPLPLPPLPEPAISLTLYAYNIENIMRLLQLEGWTHLSASEKASAESSSTGGGKGGSVGHGGTARTLLGFTETAKVGGVGGAVTGPSPSFPMLESWVFDNDVGYGDVGLISVFAGRPM